MDLTYYVDALRQQLAVAAEAGGDESRALAERLTAPLESGIRLALLNALSAAADEITRDLAPGSVDLRLRSGEPTFVVLPPALEHSFSESEQSTEDAPPPVPPESDEGPMTRINVRLAEALKNRIEQAAGQAGLSVNAWLVRAAAASLESDIRGRPAARRTPTRGDRYTGWVR
ncbi:MAG TPA: hypothetical protein VG317_04565 [Pseudonocardiaceae bacterium]|jgi:hypothetical protein|nr:hypothetical protein [Pseudonocardiaceae bacterium]